MTITYIPLYKRRVKPREKTLPIARGQIAIANLTEEDLYFFDERAGIYEYEAGLSREEAQARAYADLKQLKYQTLKLSNK